MAGGKVERHIDEDYLITGTHKAGTSTTLTDRKADFASCGVMDGLYIENTTQDESSLVATATEEEVTTDDDVSWDNGDTYEIYKTGTKDSKISTQWVDMSRGWRTDPKKMTDGWRNEDLDIDRNNPGRVFGPGQPSKG